MKWSKPIRKPARDGLAILLPLSLLTVCGVQADGEVSVQLREKRFPVANDAVRAGLEVAEREANLGNLRLAYHQLVDPRNHDAPVVKGYGDYLMRCEFPIWNWNWDLEYFLDATITDVSGKSAIANRARVQEGMFVLERGNRAVVDMVWPLAGELTGKLIVRLVKLGANDKWFYLEVSLEGAAESRISQLRVGAYPFTTTGPPERQRWVTSLTSTHQMGNARSPLDASTEWGLVLHNRNAHETGGCLLVFDPEEIESVKAGGTYNVATFLDPKPNAARAVHLAVGYFWDQPCDQAISAFRTEAESKLRSLRSLPWAVKLDASRWISKRKELDQLIQQNALAQQHSEPWTNLSRQIDQCLAAIDANSEFESTTVQRRAGQRKFLQLMKELPELENKLYGAAVQSLIEAN